MKEVNDENSGQNEDDEEKLSRIKDSTASEQMFVRSKRGDNEMRSFAETNGIHEKMYR